LLMTMESIVMKSELLCRHAITKWVAIMLGGYVWKRHTYLCSRWQLSMKRGSSQDEVRVNIPKLYLVSAKHLKSPVLVFEENPGLCESWRGKQYVWSVRDRRTEWSKWPTTILLTWMTKVVQVTAVIVDYSWLIWYKEDRLNSFFKVGLATLWDTHNTVIATEWYNAYKRWVDHWLFQMNSLVSVCKQTTVIL
jgi:hypothetical protein